jgi:DNA helicase HerA-like ATPase
LDAALPAQRRTPPVRVPLGAARRRDGAAEPLIWDSTTMLTAHGLIVGGSGTGKSFTIERLVADMARAANVTIAVIDPHGTLRIPGAETVRISQSTPVGLNPLAIVDDKDFGGVRRRVNAFIGLLLRTATLGDRQKAALSRLMIRLYRNYGFEADRAETWSLRVDPRPKSTYAKRHPNIGDLRRYLYEKMEELHFGTSRSAHRAFEDVAKHYRALRRQHTARGGDGPDEAKIEQLKAAAVDAYRKGLDQLETGNELQDILEWESLEQVKALFDRIESLESTGIFKGEQPRFTSRIQRYDISPLLRTEQQAFVDCLMEQEFFEAKLRGEATGVDRFLFLDEAPIFLDRKDPDHILAIHHREARKFGIGLWLACQAIDELPQAALTSSATKMLLGVDASFHRATETRLGLEPNKLKWIKPKETMLVQLKRAADPMANRFYDVTIAPAA